ncbi:ATP-binding protein (plasmid) [Sphingobium sp. SJ10-10]|uniref:ATP-binding response regulator n=1 Tax=Sphingobium sp. SJ10-10 TaxID=3114999 RepID=UPI002E1708FB|nr:ATP-binding protein [Sphingobium sp. SJ10-10]
MTRSSSQLTAEAIDRFWNDASAHDNTMLELVAISANDGIWGWEVDSGRSYYSRRWWELIGEEPDQMEPHIDNFFALLHPDDRERVLDAQTRFISGEAQEYRVEFRLRHRQGGWRWILSRGSAVRDPHGKAIRLAGTHTDITDRVDASERLERLIAERTKELVAARDRAELAAAATSKFLSATSHDVRQPLQAMALLLGSLQDEQLSAAGQRTLEGVHRSLIASMELLDDLLEFSRLEAGALRPSVGPVNLGDLMQSVVDSFAIQARQKGVHLIVRPTRLKGRSDAQLIGRIIRNLASNSLKFTASGKILIAARSRGPNIRIEVWDSGVGIQPELQRQIFWEFVQDGRTSDVNSSGLGLGLAIVERLSRLLGHRIGLRSEPGRGSVFWVEIPKMASEPAHQGSHGGLGLKMPGLPAGCRIALIENDAEIGEAFLKLLRGWGARVVWARSGESMLSQLANEAPDLVIADWHLDGEIDGFEAFDRLEDRFGYRLPGVILTGDHDVERIKKANRQMRRVLHKPILPDILNAVLQTELRDAP